MIFLGHTWSIIWRLESAMIILAILLLILISLLAMILKWWLAWMIKNSLTVFLRLEIRDPFSTGWGVLKTFPFSTSNSWFDCWKGIEKIWSRFWTTTKFSIGDTRWCIFFRSKITIHFWFIREAITKLVRMVWVLPGRCSLASECGDTEFWNCNWAHNRSLQSRSFCQISITAMKWTLCWSPCTINHIDC